jgi:hypothetical protein
MSPFVTDILPRPVGAGSLKLSYPLLHLRVHPDVPAPAFLSVHFRPDTKSLVVYQPTYQRRLFHGVRNSLMAVNERLRSRSRR